MQNQNNYTKCIICNNEAVGKSVVDIDLPPLYYCKDHDFDVQMYFILSAGNDKVFTAESWLKNCRELYVKKTNKPAKPKKKKRINK
jgi:hypothetical protein